MKRMEDSFLLNRLFDDTFQQMRQRSGFVPQVDVVESEDRYEIHLAIPGVKKEDFQVEFQRNQLSISGERKEIRTTENTKLHHVESFQGKFRRVFTIPENVNPSQIEAKYEDGMLVVVIPKDAESSKKTVVNVQ